MLRELLILTAIAGLCCVEGRSIKDLGEWRALNTLGDIWKDCSKPGDHGKILNASIVPDPPVRGKPVNISAYLSTDEVISSGKVEINLIYGGFLPYTMSYDLCDLTKKIDHACPLSKGVVHVSVPTKIPKEAPKGKYEGHVKATDQNGLELACIELNVTLE